MTMVHRELRIALFSGNYNYVRDGANQALNRLVDFLLRQGAAVRVYSPTTDTPAFPPAGELISVPSLAIPGGRGEYRFATHLSREIRQDIRSFKPNVIHVSSPDMVGHDARDLGKELEVPVIASMHTRFETYPRYYGFGFLEGTITSILRRFYKRCDAVVAPSESAAAIMRAQGMSENIDIWARGIDRTLFSPAHRNAAWRGQNGFIESDVVIAFVGRLVMEKGLDVFCETLAILKARGIAHKVTIVGEGPAKPWLVEQLPDAVFCGFQSGLALGQAVASADILFNPSVTESFGNVTLEAMACGLPVVAARASGSDCLVQDGHSGILIEPGHVEEFADALQFYSTHSDSRRDHGRNGATIADGYDWDNINQAMIDTYMRAIKTRQLRLS